MAELLADTYFWTGSALTLIIVCALFMGAPKMVAGMLDSRAKRISNELDEARQLKEEAQQLLATYQRQQREAETEAQDIVEQAKKDALVMAEETRAQLNEKLERRTRLAEEKIGRAEAQAKAEIKNAAADAAVEAARRLIADQLDDAAKGALLDQSIQELSTRLN